MNMAVPRLLCCGLFALGAAQIVSADIPAPLEAPTGEVILEVCGNIAVHNQGDCAVFDVETLKAIGHVHLETSTIWTEGVQRFDGVRLKDLLQRVGAQGKSVWASAANDYGADIPVTDATEDGPILAYMLNNEEMSLRDMGPLWVIYPYDHDSKFRSDLIYSRSVWQLVSMEVRE